MNPNATQPCGCSARDGKADASLQVPLLALFGGAALWLVAGLALGLIAGIKFHAPDFLGACPLLTYGRVVAAANNLVLYGFAIPAALGVMLWVLTRSSRMPLVLPLVPVAAANIWHLGVLVGVAGIFLGGSTGYPWLEFSRAAAVLQFTAFLLIAVSAAATLGWRREQELFPAHWFIYAALVWFAWTYSSANLFLNGVFPPRGVVQNIIDWWFTNNLLFVWLGLAGLGIGFYLLPRLGGRPLTCSGLTLFGFLGLIFFGTWCGIPIGAPVPAWLPVVSIVAALLTVPAIIALGLVSLRTALGAQAKCLGGPLCFTRFGLLMFFVSSLLYLLNFCPKVGPIVQFTWFGFGLTQLQLLGFFAMIVFGGIYEALPEVMGRPLPFAGLVRVHFFANMIGVLLFTVPLLIGGVAQGLKLLDATAPFADSTQTALKFLRISSLGQLFILVGAGLFALNLFVMTLQWKLALVKSLIAAAKAPLPDAEVKA